MPWYDQRTGEYVCDDCGVKFRNAVAEAGANPWDVPRSPVTIHGGNETRCLDCATKRNRHFLSPVKFQGVAHSTTITYRIHNGGNYSFHGNPTPMTAVGGPTGPAMTASGALNLMAHPAYPGGMIRWPNAFSGPNLGHEALRAWPGDARGKEMHHVHVGQGPNQRVLFGWSARAYPPPSHAYVQAITLYIGS